MLSHKRSVGVRRCLLVDKVAPYKGSLSMHGFFWKRHCPVVYIELPLIRLPYKSWCGPHTVDRVLKIQIQIKLNHAEASLFLGWVRMKWLDVASQWTLRTPLMQILIAATTLSWWEQLSQTEAENGAKSQKILTNLHHNEYFQALSWRENLCNIEPDAFSCKIKVEIDRYFSGIPLISSSKVSTKRSPVSPGYT